MFVLFAWCEAGLRRCDFFFVAHVYQICDSFRCEPQVYSTAVTTLDRFLVSGKLTRGEEVGVYAAASIFVACKHSGKYMKANSLVRFTGNFFSEEQLKVCLIASVLIDCLIIYPIGI